jgi:aspartyl protease family protein
MHHIPAMWQELPLHWIAIAIGIIFGVALLQRIPVIGGVVRLGVTLSLIGVAVLLLTERMPFDPMLASIAERLKLGGQMVEGKETRIRMAANGHFFADVAINGVRRRMLIDSGATVTALSAKTAREAGLRTEEGLMPVMIQTANGAVPARTAEVPELRLGNIVARDLAVVVSPAFGDIDVIGMNFLSKLKGWRVEGRTLILTPNHPQRVTA